MEITQQYINIKNYLAIALSPTGQGLFKDKSWVLEEAQRLSKVVDKAFLDYRISQDAEFKTEYKDLKAFEEFKKTLDPTDLEITATVDANMNEILSKVQDKATYDPSVFYDTYFTQIDISQKSGLPFTTKAEPSFQEWFRGSKVADNNDNPLLVYHGRYKEEVSRFSFDNFPAKYFAENKSYAQWFANANKTEGTFYNCYLRVLNPIDLTDFEVAPVRYEDFVNYMKLKYGYSLPENKMLRAMSEREPDGMWTWMYLRHGVDWLKFIIKEGKFDGIHFFENNPKDLIDGKENITPAWMVFRANQIKSASANLWSNNNSKDIRFKKGGRL